MYRLKVVPILACNTNIRIYFRASRSGEGIASEITASLCPTIKIQTLAILVLYERGEFFPVTNVLSFILLELFYPRHPFDQALSLSRFPLGLAHDTSRGADLIPALRNAHYKLLTLGFVLVPTWPASTDSLSSCPLCSYPYNSQCPSNRSPLTQRHVINTVTTRHSTLGTPGTSQRLDLRILSSVASPPWKGKVAFFFPPSYR